MSSSPFRARKRQAPAAPTKPTHAPKRVPSAKPKRVRAAKPTAAPKKPRTRKVPAPLLNPCEGCPCAAHIKVPPTLPATRKVIAVGMAPGEEEESEGRPFVGRSGRLLRKALRDAGLDDQRDVGYINLARCRPDHSAGYDNFETKEWAEAEKRCATYLQQDLADWHGPLLLLGARPMLAYLQDKRAKITAKRSMWYLLPGGGDAFVENHPSAILREGGEAPHTAAHQRFCAGIKRMADRVLGREIFPEVRFEIHPSVAHGARRLRWLVEQHRPFFFDIETFDAAECPSRKGVATNPFHPDFRVRGVAIAWSGTEGAWFELTSDEANKGRARALLDPLFTSDVEKGAFFGSFDANGLLEAKWVSDVRNRCYDPWLGAIALDTVGGGHSLERLAIDVLGEPQPKAGVDRSRIREMTLAAVGEYAVKDACLEWRLNEVIMSRLAEAQYLE